MLPSGEIVTYYFEGFEERRTNSSCTPGKMRRMSIFASILAVAVIYLICMKLHLFNRDDWPLISDYTNLYSYNLVHGNSTCGAKSTLRGPGQKVISFSFYGQLRSRRDYFHGIAINAKLLQKLYPDWVMRVYHDLSDGSLNQMLDDLQTEFGSSLDLCFVGNLPGYGDLRGAHKMIWRYLTLTDPLVEVTVFRDLDSSFSQRETDAVNEWLLSPSPLHVMRDNPFHVLPIQGQVQN